MAARSDVFDVRELSKLFDDRIRLLGQEARTAVARHRSLAAALDWSYELLPRDERVILARLSVFAGSFTPESACVVAEIPRSGRTMIEAVASLVTKSLISADVVAPRAIPAARYHARPYALQQLAKSSDAGVVVRRHAEHHRSCSPARRPRPQRAPAPSGSRNTVERSTTFAAR